MDLCQRMLRKPVVAAERFSRVWAAEVAPLRGAYEMQP
jgi:hypothetical protein